MTNHDLPSRYTHEYRDDIGAARTELARTRNRVRAGQDVSVDLIVEAAEQLIDRWVRQRKVTEHARDEFNAAIDSEIRIRQRLRAILDTVAGLTFDTADSSDDLVPVEPERPPRSIAASSLDQAEIGIRALGPFEVWRRGRRLECGRGTKAFRLGRYLLTQPARPIQRDVLLELFWPEGNPDAGRRNLHQAVYVLRKLLARAGIRSHVALLFAHDGLPLAPALPVIAGYFNHAILRVELPDGSLFVDPTARTVPFGELPASDQEAQVLLIDERGAQLAITPSTRAADNREELRLDLALGLDGAAHGTYHAEAIGAPAASLRQRLLDAREEDRRDVVAAWFPVETATWSPPAIADLSPGTGAPPLHADGEIALARSLSSAGVERVLRLSEILRGWTPAPPAPDRDEPVLLRYRSTSIARVALTLPPGVAVAGLPPPVTVEGAAGRYRLIWSSRPGALIVERELVLAEHVFEQPLVGPLRELLQRAIAAEARPIVLMGGGR